MEKFQKLTRVEMKNVLGGNAPGGGGDPCDSSECSSNADCKDSRWPKCYISTCQATGAAANICGVA